MAAPDLSLLARRRLGPLFVVQFSGAMNDNLLKFALLFLANFTLYATQPARAAQLATIATGLFILPYFLFSALAGQMADRWDKARLIRGIKAAEVAIMALALIGFQLQSVAILLACLFLMGCHSTVFGPVKYSILPQHLAPHEIMGGTGVVEAGTFIAILTGQLLAGIVSPWTAGAIATGCAVAGLVASLAVPPAPSAVPDLTLEANIAGSTARILKTVRGRDLWLAIGGISWFFSVGAVLLSQFAPLVSGPLDAGAPVVTLFLLIFSLSVAVGSIGVNRLLGGVVSARYVPAAALAMGVGMIALWIAAARFAVEVPGAGVAAFVATPAAWPVLAALVVVAAAGGMFVVPLYAILQTASPPAERSRTIAANNIVNAVVTVVLVIAATLVLGTGAGVPGVIGLMGVATVAVAAGARRMLRQR